MKNNSYIRASLIEPSFCTILQQEIFTILSLCSMCSSLKDTAVTINALVRVNKYLNTFVNDDTKTLQLIKQLSDAFDCSNIDVARSLCTKAANNRFALQQAFLVGWNYKFAQIEKDINKLKNMGLDLDFSYEKEQPTALLKTTFFRICGYANVACWLIENGADITICNPTRRNAAMIALANDNKNIINVLLNHPALEVNHRDNDNNTLLHCCFEGINSVSYQHTKHAKTIFYIIIGKLLDRGANPTIKNNQDKTPLDLAKALKAQALIELL